MLNLARESHSGEKKICAVSVDNWAKFLDCILQKLIRDASTGKACVGVG